MNPLSVAIDHKTVTCKHCLNSQRHVEFFDFCEFCKKPLDLSANADHLSFVSGQIGKHNSEEIVAQHERNG